MEETKLIVHNLPGDFTTERLHSLFGSYGEITEGEFKWGVGFVRYAEADGAEAAFFGMNQTKVDGKPIKIDFLVKKEPTSRLIVKNLPTSEFTSGDLKELFESFGALTECDYKWGFGFIQFKEEKSVVEAVKALKGKEVAPGKKIFFETQGPDGEAKSKDDAEDDIVRSVHGKIGPVCLFIGALNEGTTVEEVTEVVERFGELTKVDVKGTFGFIHFKYPDSCRNALSVLPRKIINGAHPRVQLGEIKKGGKIYVGNLHEGINQEELISAFLAHGSIVEYKFVRQFAFFCYDFIADAMRAVKNMNGKEVCGVKLNVAISTAHRDIPNGVSDTCRLCGMPGHIPRYCPSDKKDVCHNCGISGHWAKECPNPSRSGGASYGTTSRDRSRSPS